MNETKPFWSTEPQDLTDRFVETVSPDAWSRRVW